MTEKTKGQKLYEEYSIKYPQDRLQKWQLVCQKTKEKWEFLAQPSAPEWQDYVPGETEIPEFAMAISWDTDVSGWVFYGRIEKTAPIWIGQKYKYNFKFIELPDYKSLPPPKEAWEEAWEREFPECQDNGTKFVFMCAFNLGKAAK